MLTRKEKDILQFLQDDFPLEERPFAVSAEKFGIEENDFLSMLSRLKRRKVIRYLGAIFDPARLGVHSLLCAAKVPSTQVKQAAAAVSSFRQVSHNYLRSGELNLWFTVSAGSTGALRALLHKVGEKSGIDIYTFPVVRIFKIDARFPLGGVGRKKSPVIRHRYAGRVNKKIVLELNVPFSLSRRPFAEAASRLNMSDRRLVELVRRWREAGIIRRFGLILSHRRAGFSVNCMVAWKVVQAPGKAGSIFASSDRVTHCYQRRTRPGWPYNLYTMIHCRSKAECERLVDALAKSAGVSEYRMLFTLREYKKTKADLAAIL